MASERKLSIWTDKTDYVVAESAEAARRVVMRESGLDDSDVSPVAEWSAYPDDKLFPWQEEEDGPKTRIPAAEAVRRLTEGMDMSAECSIADCTCRCTIYFASTEW